MCFVDKVIKTNRVEYVGQFQKEGNELSFDWVMDRKLLNDKRGRVYFFIEVSKDGIKKILKIGKSNSKSGIKGTLSNYINALKGTPGINRFSLHHMIYDKLKEKKQMLVYCIFIESVKKEITGLFKTKLIEIPLDVTYVEELCLKEYFEEHLNYPEWNFQESHTKIPLNLIESFGRFIENKKLTRKK